MADSGYFNHPRPELLRYFPADARRTLDVGCGEGTFSAGLKERFGVEAWGIEIDEAAAAAAASRLDTVRCGDAIEHARDLPAGHFDCVFLNDILEHLVEPEVLLRELTGALAPDGIIVASIPNVRYFPHLRQLVVHGRWEYTDEGILDRTHLRFFTRDSMVAMFRRCGYLVERVDGIHPTRSSWWGLFNAVTLGLCRDMRYLQFVCVARPDR